MSPWKTLFRYFLSRFFIWCATVFLAMQAIVFILDYIDLLKRGGTRPDATFLALLEMAVLKQPDMAQKVMPFAILFGTMMAFWRLTRSNELVIARAAGVSVWQFLSPPVAGAALIGVVAVAVFNPIASILQARYEMLDNRIMHGSGDDQLALSRSGLWLRQTDDEGHFSVIHAGRLLSHPTKLEDVMVLLFSGDAKLSSRLDAKAAVLQSGTWQVEDGTRWTVATPSEPFAHVVVPTKLTPRKLQESFASPETMSFWELPGFIRLLESSGFSAQHHRLYFDTLLARPFLFTAMVLVAAAFSLRMQRRGGTALMIAGGISVGFLLYFLSDVMFALGFSATIPVLMAAWTPAGISWLLGASMLLHLEDG
jgi:lipopolysaccharide export system permease protein